MHRIPQLDGLRAVAILMVFATHAFNLPLLWMGVDLFFLLSGYLITGILLRLKEQRATHGYWKPFYLRRARRILPPYAGFLLAATILFTLPWAHIWYWYAFFGANFVLAFGKANTALTPLWSLAVEEQFYLIWPLVVLCCGRKTLRNVAIGIVLVSPLLRAIATPFFSTHFPIYCLTLFRADTLAFGAFIALSERQHVGWIAANRRVALYVSIAAGLVLGTLSLFPAFRTGLNTVFFNSLGYSLSVAIFGGALIHVLGMRSGTLHAILTAAPVRFLGRISYTFYLYHVAVLLKVEHWIHSPALTALLSFVVTVAIAAVSWKFLEAPILKVRPAPRPEIPRAAAA